MKKRLFESLAFVLVVILYLVPNYIAPICSKLKPDGNPMGCYYSGNFVMKLAVFIFVINLVMFLVAKYSFGKYIRILGSLVNIVISALVYMVPHRIISLNNEIGVPYRFCGKPKMECILNNTFGVAGIVAGLIALVMVMNLLYLFLKKDN